MNERPGRLLSTTGEIQQMALLVRMLDDEEQVRLTLDDGRLLEDVVAVRPSIQLFRDADGQEGSNALLRLDPLAGYAAPHYLWLDRVVEVARLGSA